jgi:hypothetical protein
MLEGTGNKGASHVTLTVTTRYTGKSQVDKVRILKNSKLRRKEV